MLLQIWKFKLSFIGSHTYGYLVRHDVTLCRNITLL